MFSLSARNNFESKGDMKDDKTGECGVGGDSLRHYCDLERSSECLDIFGNIVGCTNLHCIYDPNK